MRTTIAILATLLVSVPCTAFGDEVDSYIGNQMSHRGIPGLAFAVVHDGRVIDSRAYGSANLETKTPVSLESVFEIASLTKPLTATAIVRLADSGVISLQDPITRHIADAPVQWETITVGHLLSHTAGFPEQLIVSSDGVPLQDVSTKQQYTMIVESPRLFDAGAHAAYSDPGYFLLGMIMESATARPYAEAMQMLLFDPCSMARSLILDQWRIVEGRVAGYTKRGEMLLNARRDWQHELPSFFGVMSTVGDLAQFEIAYDAGSLIGSEWLERMQTPTVLDDGKTADVFGREYGLGWQLGDYRGYRTAEHGGFSGTCLLRFPDEHFAVIVLTNLDIRSGSRPDLLARGIAGLYDERFLLPDVMVPVAIPVVEATAHMSDLFGRAESWAEATELTADFRRRWGALPPRVQEGRARVLSSLQEVVYIGRDEPHVSPLTRFGERVSEIRYFRGESGSGATYITVWMNPDGLVQDVQYYRP